MEKGINGAADCSMSDRLAGRVCRGGGTSACSLPGRRESRSRRQEEKARYDTLYENRKHACFGKKDQSLWGAVFADRQ